MIGWQVTKRCVMLIVASFKLQRESSPSHFPPHYLSVSSSLPSSLLSHSLPPSLPHSLLPHSSLTLSLPPPSLLPPSLPPPSLTPSPFLPPLSSLLYTCRSLFLSSMPSLLLGCSGGGSCMNWLRRIPVTHRDLTRSPREMWLCTPQGVSCSVCHAVGREWRGGEGRMREEGKMV